MFLILLTGHIDLSVGSGVGLIGGIAAVRNSKHGWPAPAALGLAFACALVLWTLMGSLIVAQKIPSFIITLGGLLIFKGLFWLVIQNSTVPVSRGDQDNLYSALTTYYLPSRIGFLIAALLVVALGTLTWRSRSTRMTAGMPVRSVRQSVLGFLVAAGAILFAVRDVQPVSRRTVVALDPGRRGRSFYFFL